MVKKSMPVLVSVFCWDGEEIADSVRATLPNVTWMTATLTGAGIAGSVDIPIQGLAESMSMSIDLSSVGKNAYRMLTPGVHKVELRFNRNVMTGNGMVKQGTKMFISVMSTSLVPGKIEQGTAMEGSISFAVTRFRVVEDGREVFLIDQMNPTLRVRGVDYSDMYRV